MCFLTRGTGCRASDSCRDEYLAAIGWEHACVLVSRVAELRGRIAPRLRATSLAERQDAVAVPPLVRVDDDPVLILGEPSFADYGTLDADGIVRDVVAGFIDC